MGFLLTGKEGTPVKDIIAMLGNKDYEIIDFRCQYKDRENQMQDLYYGSASYTGRHKKLKSIDGDIHKLSDKFVRWSETSSNEKNFLTVWEAGDFMDDWSQLYKRRPFKV